MSTSPQGSAPSGVEADAPRTATDASAGQSIMLGRHVRFTQVHLQDQTDKHNELVHTRNWLLHPSERLELRGNLFVAHDLETGGGLIFLKAAPLPHARPEEEATDIVVKPSGNGYETLLLGGDRYTWHTIDYAGDDLDQTAALQGFQKRQSMLPVPWFITNTWGDRSRDGRLGHDFVLTEIDAAARLGADLLQIDDGWQRGRTSNSVEAKTAGGVWEGFHDALPDFWTPDPVRFPQGLEPIVEAANRRDLLLGLWFAPDSSADFAHWEDDAQTLIALHERYGVASFKLDSIDIRSRTGEQRVRQMIDAVNRGTHGKAVLDLDITAGNRLGYFGMIEAGLLFVENRYTDWRRYWPHQTLRNLWSLAPWVDPGRLRFEFLNHARNAEKYGDDPLAPARYSPAALFATTMFANPLGWFECSNLPDAYAEQIAPLAAMWKRHRADIAAGTILGIGAAPDGFHWTGLTSIAPDRRSAHVLAFRGHAAEPEHIFPLPGRLQARAVRTIAGEGSGKPSHVRDLRVAVEHPREFVWLHADLA